MIVNCVAYQAGKKITDIKPEEISDYVSREDCFVWVALAEPSPAELALMQHEFGLHPLAVEDSHHGHQRPKIEEYEDSLFVVLQTVEIEADELHLGEVDIFIGTNYILSVRSRAKRGFADVRARCEREPHLLKQGASFVLYALMDAVVDRYFPVLDELEQELETIEERMFANASGRANVEALYDLKQKLMVMKHAVAPLLEGTSKLHGGRVPALCADTQEYFRDVHDHLTRINQSIDAQRDLVITAISVNLSLITIGENEVTKRLAGYAALVAVPTMIAGIYGMNFQHMPELGWIYGYPFALAVMVVLDSYLFYRFRRAKWI
ncbi:MAG: magnesium and cobalt transport protein CorA [Betaproteobacteria bacterium RIFCSPLOWO2_02_FULL_62_17]|nr:MAG: magnesium and cobalt transport protein CorA [Betaproteobacteria bacterium RIFCSPLOWO2_02_FULL_62_17]